MEININYNCTDCVSQEVCKYKNNEKALTKELENIKTTNSLKSENPIQHISIKINCKHYLKENHYQLKEKYKI